MIGIIEDIALQILDKYPICNKMPASISGKYHIGETQKQHLEMAVNVMKHLCREFNISDEDTDMLIAAAWLHDIGLYVITRNVDCSHTDGWKYYKETGYSRLMAAMQSHGTIGAALLSRYEIPRKDEIIRLVSVHMSHWYPMQPQPKTMYERLICTADYIASKGNGIFDWSE